MITNDEVMTAFSLSLLDSSSQTTRGRTILIIRVDYVFSLKIMVCGSIGYGGVNDIKNLYSFLQSNGFSTVNHVVQKGMDYSNIDDFRDKRELSRRIVNHDLRYVREADVLVVIANSPSYGTGMEMFMARQSGKKVILLAEDPIPTPWPINFSDYIIKNESELISLLRKLQNEAS